jgi:hypothetical protein
MKVCGEHRHTILEQEFRCRTRKIHPSSDSTVEVAFVLSPLGVVAKFRSRYSLCQGT